MAADKILLTLLKECHIDKILEFACGTDSLDKSTCEIILQCIIHRLYEKNDVVSRLDLLDEFQRHMNVLTSLTISSVPDPPVNQSSGDQEQPCCSKSLDREGQGSRSVSPDIVQIGGDAERQGDSSSSYSSSDEESRPSSPEPGPGGLSPEAAPPPVVNEAVTIINTGIVSRNERFHYTRCQTSFQIKTMPENAVPLQWLKAAFDSVLDHLKANTPDGCKVGIVICSEKTQRVRHFCHCV